MTDITKCSNKECPLKKNCYRFKAPAGSYQSYSDFEYDKIKKCEYYWEIKERRKDV